MRSEMAVAPKAISGTGWAGLGRKSQGGAMPRAPLVLKMLQLGFPDFESVVGIERAL